MSEETSKRSMTRLLGPAAVAVACGAAVALVVSNVLPPAATATVDLSEGEKLRRFAGLPQIQLYQPVGFSADGSTFLTGRITDERSGVLQVWRTSDGALSATLPTGTFLGNDSNWHFTAAASPDGKLVAVETVTDNVYEPFELSLWSTEGPRRIWKVSLYHPLIKRPDGTGFGLGRLDRIVFHPDGKSFWGIISGRATRFAVDAPRVMDSLAFRGAAIAFSDDGRLAAMLAGGWSLIDLESRRRIAHLTFDTSHLPDAELSFADGGRVLAASVPRESIARETGSASPQSISRTGLTLLDTVTWAEIAHYPDEVLLAVSADGQQIATQDAESVVVRIRDAVSGGERARVQRSTPAALKGQVSAHPNDGFLEWRYGPTLRFASSETAVSMNHLLTLKPLGSAQADSLKARLSPDGRTLAAIHGSTLSLYDWPLSSRWKLGLAVGTAVAAAVLMFFKLVDRFFPQNNAA